MNTDATELTSKCAEFGGGRIFEGGAQFDVVPSVHLRGRARFSIVARHLSSVGIGFR